MKLTASLKQKLANIPSEPGIYKMLDKNGDIIYIGKSKSLDKRVRSYFTGSHKWSKISNLAAQIRDIEYVVTDTHLEARILECELIKRYRPRYNSQMKNDRQFVYIKIEADAKNNSPLTIVSERDDYCYGPFRNKYKIREIIDNIKFFYPISRKNDQYILDYHVIPSDMDNEAFNMNKKCLMEIFSNPECMNRLIHSAAVEMEKAASEYKYETAQRYRDIMYTLDYINYSLNHYKELMSQDIIIRIPVESGYKLFLVKNGSITAAQKHDNPTENDMKIFRDLISFRKESILDTMDEKARIDFLDILYTEILSLPKNDVIFLNGDKGDILHTCLK